MAGSIELPKPIIGFRSWRVSGNRLIPRHRDAETPWRPRGNAIAKCEYEDHAAPAPGCRCGLYGTYEYQPYENGGVAGVFLGFGEIALHGRGFRAGKGRIVGLLTTECPDQARKIAALYELPIFDDPEELAKEAERWGERRESSEEGLNSFAQVAQRYINVIGSKPITLSGYRAAFGGPITPVPPARSHHAFPGREARRAVVVLELGYGVEIQHIQHPGGGMVTRIKGLPDCWTIRTVEEEVERIEVPLPGHAPVGIRPGARRITIEVEANFTTPEEMRESLRALQAFGRIVSETPIV